MGGFFDFELRISDCGFEIRFWFFSILKLEIADFFDMNDLI